MDIVVSVPPREGAGFGRLLHEPPVAAHEEGE
jgi:hypothetical protein